MKSASYIGLVILLVSCAGGDDGFTIVGNDEVPQSFADVVWAKNFGGSGDESPRSIITTNDGGYAVFGLTNSTDGDLADKQIAVNDYWLIKLDANGNLQWQRTYGGSKDDQGQQAIQTSDGGYAITGYAMSDDGDASNNEGFHDNWILRLDSTGNVLWEKSFGFSGHDHSYDIIETEDGGFFFTGFLDVTSSNGAGSTEKSSSLSAHGVGEFWGTKVDADGNLVWRKFFGGTNNDRSFGVIGANDGGYILVGASESDDFDISNPKGSYDYWVVKVDKNGNFVWERSFGGTGIDQSYDITKTADGHYAVIGNSFSTDLQITGNHGESDIWLVKFDDSGDLIWQQNYGGAAFDAARGINLASDGGFIISGNSKSFDKDATTNFGENDIWVIKTNADGTIAWQRSFGGLALDFGYDAVQAADGSYVVVGETSSLDFPDISHKGGADIVVLKIQ